MSHRSTLGAIAAAALALFIVGCGNAGKTMSAEDRGSDVVRSDSATSSERSAGDGKDADDAPEAVAGELEVTESGFVNVPSSGEFGDPYASAAAIIHNPSDLIAGNVQTQLTLLDADGDVLKSTNDVITAVLPDATAAISMVEDNIEGVADVQVQVRANSWDTPEGELGELTVGDLGIRPVDYGGADVNGVVTSTVGQDLQDVELTIVFRDANGVPVGGTFTYIDFIPAKGESPFTVSTFHDIPDGWTAEGFAVPSWLTLLD